MTDTITPISSVSVSAADGDQVRLILSHPTAGTNTILASYEFFKLGVSQGVVQLAGSGDIYHDEIWTRPEFRISQTAPIPEPDTYAMMLVGIGLVGCALRRTRR